MGTKDVFLLYVMVTDIVNVFASFFHELISKICGFFGIYRYKYWESIGISYGFLFIFFGDDLCCFVTKNAQVSQSAGKEKDYGFS